MSETQQSTTDKEVKAGKLDYNALADAFEAQGNVIEAKRFRDLARRQPEETRQSIAKTSAHLDKKLKDEKRSQPVIMPLQRHERADASRNVGLREKIEKMLQLRNKR